MFFLRCAFWLTIVYTSICFSAGALRSPHAFEAAVASETSGVADAVVARATDWCAERPGHCVRDAARLTALVQSAVAAEPAGPDDMVVAEATAPLPVPDPRRRAARAVLTGGR